MKQQIFVCQCYKGIFLRSELISKLLLYNNCFDYCLTHSYYPTLKNVWKVSTYLFTTSTKSNLLFLLSFYSCLHKNICMYATYSSHYYNNIAIYIYIYTLEMLFVRKIFLKAFTGNLHNADGGIGRTAPSGVFWDFPMNSIRKMFWIITLV